MICFVDDLTISLYSGCQMFWIILYLLAWWHLFRRIYYWYSWFWDYVLFQEEAYAFKCWQYYRESSWEGFDLGLTKDSPYLYRFSRRAYWFVVLVIHK